MRASVFLGFIQRGGIGDPLTALFAWEGITDEVRWADQALRHGGSSLDGNELIHKGLVKAAAKLTESLGQDKMGLRGMHLVLLETTGIHDGKVGSQAMADLLIGGSQCMLEQLQGEQGTDGHGPSTTRGGFREPFLETLLDGADESHPGKGVRPLPDGMHDRDKICDLQGGSGTAQPMLKITHNTHRWLSYRTGEREPPDTPRQSASQAQ